MYPTYIYIMGTLIYMWPHMYFSEDKSNFIYVMMVLRLCVLCVHVLQVDIVRNVIFFFIQIFHLFKDLYLQLCARDTNIHVH